MEHSMKSAQPTQSRGPGRSRRCSGHCPLPSIDAREVCCRNCEERLKNGTSRPTRIKWCELCSSYHSAKNYRRERERCTTLSGNKSVDVPPLSPNLSETNLSELYEGSHSLFDGISRTPLPFHDERNETRTDLEADYPGNFRHGNTTNREYGDEINHLTATEIRGALPPTSHYKAALSNEVSQLAFKVTAVDSRINSELSLEAEHNVADIFLEQDFLHKADGAFDNVIIAQESALGPLHTNNGTLWRILGKSETMYKQGDHIAAEKSFQEMLEHLRKHPNQFGSDNALSISAFFGLATTWTSLAITWKQPLLARMAQQVLSSVYVRRLRLHGLDHIDTIKTMHQLGLSFEIFGHFLKASSCLVKAMNGFAAALGKDDDSTIATKKDLARVLQGLGSSAALQGSETKLNIVEKYFASLSFHVLRGNNIYFGSDRDNYDPIGSQQIDDSEEEEAWLNAFLDSDHGEPTSKPKKGDEDLASEFEEKSAPLEGVISDQMVIRDLCSQHFEKELVLPSDSTYHCSSHIVESVLPELRKTHQRDTIYKCLVKLERVEALESKRDERDLLSALKVISQE